MPTRRPSSSTTGKRLKPRKCISRTASACGELARTLVTSRLMADATSRAAARERSRWWPRFQNVSIRFALLSLVEEVSLRNDSDELSDAIDNGKPAYPIALEKAYRFLECRLWRCSDDPSRHYRTDADHGPIVAIAKSAGLGRRTSFA